MPILRSKLDTRSPAFEKKRDDMLEMIGEIDELLDAAALGGGEKATQRLISRGKLPMRGALDPLQLRRRCARGYRHYLRD